MKKQLSISTRLVIGVSLVALLAVALFAGLSLYNTQRLFSQYLTHHKRGQQANLAQILSAYYQENGSFRGLAFSLPTPRGGMGRGPRAMGPSEYHIIIADEADLVIYDSGGNQLGLKVPEKIARLGTPIEARGQKVGTVLLSRPGQGAVLKIEEDFRSSVWRLTAMAALGSVLLAVFVSQALARRIISPLSSLSQAAERMATDQNLSLGLPLGGDDEIAALARSFNTLFARLAQSQQLRQNLLADLAHELRTPVSIIQSQLEAVGSENTQLSPKEIASLYDEVLRLGRLLEDLRTLAVAEAGEISLQASSLSLKKLGAQLETNFRPLAEVNQVELEFLIQGDQALSLYADPDRLRQILYNLLGNAFAHTPPGGKVELTAKEKQGKIQLIISDTGPGIPPEDLPLIFSRYWRGKNKKKDGLGLGLAISRALARASGGELVAQNRPGGGAQFILTLPKE